ncbi:MAG: sodium-dependent bicarbonate transport family permease [Cycloclasticus sp.]|jgi:hypothetical protein|nr:sodium-dependent bicarbonate transport family permease [Cycloclasticus sp.]
MNFELILSNLTSPALLFFFLGILGVQLKSDLAIPKSSGKFISLYLLFAIGFKGGQELSHSPFSLEILAALGFGMFLALAVPIYTFFILKRRMDTQNAGAIAATYGSVSAVTFVTAVSFLEAQGITFSGHMVAVMALMEAPAIVIGVILMQLFSKRGTDSEDSASAIKVSKMGIVKHALTNGSVFLILGSLVIGYLANEEQAMGIAPFTTDIFKGFLAIFLLDMGIACGQRIKDLVSNGLYPFLFAILVPLFNGLLTALLSGFITENDGDRLIFCILAAGASYIAVPAAMKLAAPKANPSLYVPMALAITFPFNITLGMPLYMAVIQGF